MAQNISLSDASLCDLINELAKREGETTIKLRSLSNTRPPPTRNSLLPGTDAKCYWFWKIQESMIWSVEEINFSGERDDFKSLPLWRQNQLKKIFGFFSVADTQILSNLAYRFVLEVERMEEKAPFVIQAFMELIHANTYDLITMAIFEDEIERNNIFYAVEHDPYVMKKSAFIDKYAYSELPFVYRLLAFGCAEGVFFGFLFCVIFGLYGSKYMKGIIQANLLISKDETVHRNYAGYLFKKYRAMMEKGGVMLNMDLVWQIIGEAVKIEIEFAKDMHDGNDPIKLDDYVIYIKKVTDDMLVEFGLDPVYNVENPIKYMEQIGNSSKTNFYEMPVTDYKRFDVKSAMDWQNKFSNKEKEVDLLDGDF